ncbi:MAG TPA: right-handed parallel beta-helix repeat-containing protein [Pseudolabrys sp.]|nr:right-handed parallel beta-helix repeat-containing protein [Pseudolabrys sp.]
MASCVRFAWLMGALLLGLLAAHPANAQAARTCISGVGDDANPCSRTAPCKTFAGAITKTAGGGEIDCLDPGGFGAVTVTKAITLDCGGGIGGQVGSILASGTNGININAGASDSVTIRNMTINGFNGSGVNGIKFNTGGSLTIENTSIFGFGASSGAGVSFQPSAAGSKLIMRNVEVQNNAGDAIYISPIPGVSAAAVVSDVLATGNGLTGLHVTDGAAVTARNSIFSENGGKGV